MQHEQEPQAHFNPVIPEESFAPEAGAISYTEYSLLRSAIKHIPHPVRYMKRLANELLNGLGAQ